MAAEERPEIAYLAGQPTLLAGKAVALKEKPEPTAEEPRRWDYAFESIVKQVSRIDPDLGADLEAFKDIYDEAFRRAKAYLEVPFMGREPREGHFGVDVLLPQDFGLSSWRWTPSATGERNLWELTAAVSPSTEARAEAVFVFHRFVSFDTTLPIRSLKYTISTTEYPWYAIEPIPMLVRKDTPVKIIPLHAERAAIFLPPGLSFLPKGYITDTVECELAPFGLVFGHYRYISVLKASSRGP